MDSKIIFFLLVGLILLLFSGKFLVESSVSISKRFRIPTSIIGLTIVAFGTSAPELLVSIQAAIHGHPDIAIGNVVGSNISNILLVLGLTTIIFPIRVLKSSLVIDWSVMMAFSLILFWFLKDLYLSRPEGLFFIGGLIIYIFYSIRQTKKKNGLLESIIPTNGLYKTWWSGVLVFIASCFGLAFGASLLVENASEFAAYFGISERVISISMVAIGTSLPELVTSVIAAFKRETDISIGNILGSNFMNIASVLGITTIIKPIHSVPEILKVDMPWMLGAAVLLFIFMVPAKMGKINRFEGSLLFLAYMGYIYFIFIG